jgi:hypothetical protein
MNKYLLYESTKRKIAATAKSQDEYDRRLAALVKWLRI